MTEPVSVVGVKDALRTLNDLNKKVRRQLTKDFAEIVDPVIADARQYLPEEAPIRGFKRNWSPDFARWARGESSGEIMKRVENTRGSTPKYQGTGIFRQTMMAQGFMGTESFNLVLPWGSHPTKILAFTNGKRPKRYAGWTKNSTAFGIRMTGRDAILFDMSRRGKLGRNLDKKFGPASRVMWRAMDANKGTVEQKVQKFVNLVMRLASDQQKYHARLMRSIGRN